MRSKAIFLLGSFLLCAVMAFAQAQAQAPAANPDTVAPDIPGVVKGGTPVHMIKDGFMFTEGPVPLDANNMLFTETTANRVVKININTGESSPFVEPSNQSNALGFDKKGRLISVQVMPGNFAVGAIYPKGSESVFANSYNGKPFNRPNDLVVTSKGGIYFTDPGPVPQPGAPPLQLPQTVSVYYIPPGGKPTPVITNMIFPNGIQLSPNEKILYVNEFKGEQLVAADIQPDGTVKNQRNIYKYLGLNKVGDRMESGADGMAVDAAGRIYTLTFAGVEVISPKGEHLGTIPLSRKGQNLAFGGPDKKTLFVVGRGGAFTIAMLAQGNKKRPK